MTEKKEKSIKETIIAQINKYIPQLGVFIFVCLGIMIGYDGRENAQKSIIDNEKTLLRECELKNKRLDSIVNVLYNRLISK